MHSLHLPLLSARLTELQPCPHEAASLAQKGPRGQTPRPGPTRLPAARTQRGCLPAESCARHAPNKLLPLLGAQAQKTRHQQPRESTQRAHGEDMTLFPPAVLLRHIICSLGHRLRCSQALLLSSPQGHKLLLAPNLHR